MPGPWPSRAAQMINDLEAPIARHHPEIDQMRAALRRSGALAAAMTGSGSTVFGLFQRRRDATAAVARLSGGAWRALLTESLDRGSYARRMRLAVAALALPVPQVSTTLRVCAGRASGSRGVVGRGQAVRRGTLDPVFGGSNPPAPTRLR